MIVHFRVWIRTRETGRVGCFITTVCDVSDIQQTRHDLLLENSDNDFECLKVDLVEIGCFKV